MDRFFDLDALAIHNDFLKFVNVDNGVNFNGT